MAFVVRWGFFVIATIFRLAETTSILSAELVCTDREMQIHILLDEPLQAPARIFVKDRSMDPMCSHAYSVVADHNALMFRIPLGTCRMQRIQQYSNKFSFATSVVVSFHEMFVTEFDKSYRIACDYANVTPPPAPKAVTVGVGVTGLEENSVDDMRPESSIQCVYRLFRGSTEVGSAEVGARQVRVGDRLEHRWECENVAQIQFIFIHDCAVNPEFDLDHDPVVLDSRGCPTDPIGMGPIEYSYDGGMARSYHTAYKFADYPNLLFKCSISVCRKDVAVPGCPSTLPVDCSKSRSARSSKTLDRDNSTDIVLSESLRFGDLAETEMDASRSSIQYHCLSPHLLYISIGASILFVLILLAVLVTVSRRRTSTKTKIVSSYH